MSQDRWNDFREEEAPATNSELGAPPRCVVVYSERQKYIPRRLYQESDDKQYQEDYRQGDCPSYMKSRTST